MMPDADGSMFGTELSSWVTFPWYTQVCHGERERERLYSAPNVTSFDIKTAEVVTLTYLRE